MKSLVLRTVAGLWLLQATLSIGCDESIAKGWLVDRTRVLGVRVEARSEPSRASIAPGEPMHLAWLVVAPSGVGHLSWAYALCAPPGGNFPAAHCEGPVLASGAGASDGDLAGMDVVAPSADALTGMSELQILAAFCAGGDATLDARRFEATCADGAPPLLASGSVRLASAGPNANPEIAGDAVLFDGAPMAPATATASAPCAGDASSPTVSAGSEHTFAIRFSGAERELLPGTSEGAESLLASHVVTTGELKRQYSALAPADPVPREASVAWTAPGRDEIADGGRLAELYVVLRDGRGGEAFARRTVCVVRDP